MMPAAGMAASHVVAILLTGALLVGRGIDDGADVRTVTGILVRFEQGDYVHPVIATSEGDTLSLWFDPDEPLLAIYVALERGREMDFAIRTGAVYIWEIESELVCDMLVDASCEAGSYGEWLEVQQDRLPWEQVWALYREYYDAAFE